MANLCTDAGHGGADSGASWDGILEKDLNLLYTLALNEELKKRGHRVFTTHKSDAGVPSLGNRCRLVNAHHSQKAPEFEAIVSIHCNVAAVKDEDGTYKALSSRKGFYAIYSAESATSAKLAKSIATQCKTGNIDVNHGGMLSTVELGRTLAWIHKTSPPATLLELGFMTNPDELQLLRDAAYRKKMIKSIADGIDAYLNT